MGVATSDRLLRPATVAAAVAFREGNPGARLMGGGTLVVAERSRGVETPDAFILLSGIEELRGVTSQAGATRVGASTTLQELHAAGVAPILDSALRSLATPQIRNQATVGGNIADRRPDHTLTPCLIALNATVEIAGQGGTVEVPIVDFLARGVGAAELITAVVIPADSGFQKFVRVALRNGPGYAVASVAVAIDSSARTVRTGLGAVGSTALAAPAADGFLAGAIDWSAGTVPPGTAEEYGRLLGEASDPVSDTRSSAEYRTHAIRVMGRRLVEDWAEEVRNG